MPAGGNPERTLYAHDRTSRPETAVAPGPDLAPLKEPDLVAAGAPDLVAARTPEPEPEPADEPDLAETKAHVSAERPELAGP